MFDDPESALADKEALLEQLQGFARLAAGTLRTRRVALADADEPDDFKAEFKNETELRKLSADAQKNYVLIASMQDAPVT